MDLDCIVVDACAIIKGQGLQLRKVGKSYVTTQETIAEIRDSKGREALNNLPFEIEIRQPKDKSLAVGIVSIVMGIVSIKEKYILKLILDAFFVNIIIVTGFARKTGDFSALSLNDLKLIALTYEIDVEV